MTETSYSINLETKHFVVGQSVEVFANRAWKRAMVVKLTPAFVHISYVKNKDGKQVIGLVDMRIRSSVMGLSFDKIAAIDDKPNP